MLVAQSRPFGLDEMEVMRQLLGREALELLSAEGLRFEVEERLLVRVQVGVLEKLRAQNEGSACEA